MKRLRYPNEGWRFRSSNLNKPLAEVFDEERAPEQEQERG